MVATSREINVARCEVESDKVWQMAFDKFLQNKETFAAIDEEAQLAVSLIEEKLSGAAVLLALATARLHIEAVRRGTLPEQKIGEIEP